MELPNRFIMCSRTHISVTHCNNILFDILPGIQLESGQQTKFSKYPTNDELIMNFHVFFPHKRNKTRKTIKNLKLITNLFWFMFHRKFIEFFFALNFPKKSSILSIMRNEQMKPQTIICFLLLLFFFW